MPGDIHSMKHWKLSKMPTPERSPVIFQAKPCARTGRKKTAESNQRELLGNYRGQSKQSRLELGLRLPWIPAEQSGLLTRIATTESVSLSARMKSLPRFWNSNRRLGDLSVSRTHALLSDTAQAQNVRLKSHRPTTRPQPSLKGI
jgi:hypothetical protein